MKLKNIITIDEGLTFRNIEVLNCKTIRQLDKAIQNNKVLEIKEDNEIYKINSSYIIFYQF